MRAAKVVVAGSVFVVGAVLVVVLIAGPNGDVRRRDVVLAFAIVVPLLLTGLAAARCRPPR